MFRIVDWCNRNIFCCTYLHRCSSGRVCIVLTWDWKHFANPKICGRCCISLAGCCSGHPHPIPPIRSVSDWGFLEKKNIIDFLLSQKVSIFYYQARDVFFVIRCLARSKRLLFHLIMLLFTFSDALSSDLDLKTEKLSKGAFTADSVPLSFRQLCLKKLFSLDLFVSQWPWL